MASVFLEGKKPNWLAAITVWKDLPHHPKGGFMHRTKKTTGVHRSKPEATALKVAAEMEKIGREKAPPHGIDKEYFETRVSALMRAAGVEPPRKITTWKDFAGKWLDGLRISDGTRTKYQGEINNFTGHLGVRANHDLRTITHEDCEAFLNFLMEGGRTFTTARNALKTVRSVLKKAQTLHYIAVNPADTVQLKSEGGETTKEPFTRSEIAKIFAHIRLQIETAPRVTVREKFKDWLTVCYFGLYYGVRAHDAANRKGEEIRTEDGLRVIRFIPKKKKRKGKIVTLPLIGELANLPSSGLLTPHLAGRNHSTKYFDQILKACGIGELLREASGSGRNIYSKGFHSWRHTANTLLNDAGVDLKTRQLICDHDDVRMNLLYTHATVEQMASAIQKALVDVSC